MSPQPILVEVLVFRHRGSSFEFGNSTVPNDQCLLIMVSEVIFSKLEDALLVFLGLVFLFPGDVARLCI